MEAFDSVEPKKMPKWLAIPLGILLLPIALLCVIGAGITLVAPSVPMSATTVSIGTVLLVFSLWSFYLALRLIFVNPKKASFISSNGIRLIACVFAMIPIVSLVTGSFWDKPILYGVMTIFYALIAVRLWMIGKHRDQCTVPEPDTTCHTSDD